MGHIQRLGGFEHGANSLEVEVVLVVVFLEFVENFTRGLAGWGITRLHRLPP